MNIVSLKTAKELKTTRYFTGEPCKYGHIAERIVSNRRCSECLKTLLKEYTEINKEKILKKAAERAKKYRVEHKEKAVASRRLWASKNREKDNSYYSKWRKNNKGHVNSLNRKRQAAKLQRTPKWLTDFDTLKIQCIYSIAAMLTRVNNEPWHVDHILPLQGELVSGLHVPSNLQPMRGIENSSKSNFYEVLA